MEPLPDSKGQQKPYPHKPYQHNLDSRIHIRRNPTSITLPAKTLSAETTLPAETLSAETLPAETLPADTLPE